MGSARSSPPSAQALDKAVKAVESAVQRAQQQQVEAFRRELRNAIQRERARQARGVRGWWRRQVQSPRSTELMEELRHEMHVELRSIDRQRRHGTAIERWWALFWRFVVCGPNEDAIIQDLATAILVVCVLIGVIAGFVATLPQWAPELMTWMRPMVVGLGFNVASRILYECVVVQCGPGQHRSDRRQ